MAEDKGNRADRWARTFKALQEPMTWTFGVVLLAWEAIVRHGQDGLLVSSALALIGGYSVIRAARKVGGDE